MKKLLLILSIFIISLSASAADLNPFAYNLNSEYNEHAQTLTINFTLNAPASYVKLAISDGTQDVWTKEYLASSYQAGKVPKSTYTEVINVLDAKLPQGQNLTWRVDVKGAEVANPTFVKNDVRLYAPTSVDIDNNPENANFGTVFCVEGRNGAWHNANYTSYISHEDGAGLYVLNADGTARKMPYQTEKVRYGYNGGFVNVDKSGKEDRSTPAFGGNSGYRAYRVRVSDDGRIFITAFSTNGHVLWEAKKDCFSATTKEEWSSNTGWYKVIGNGNDHTVMAESARTCDVNHKYCGIYSLFQDNASSGTFIAGPNLGFDVRGSGDDLKLLMLAGCKQAIASSSPGHFYCDEYDLGIATLWNTPPSRRIFAGHSSGVDIVNALGVQVQYDKNGNVWMCQYRGGTTETTLAMIDRSKSPTDKEQGLNIVGGTIDHNESDHTFRRCGAIRFNEDFTQVAIASKEYVSGENSGGGFTVYPVDASTGKPIWEQGTKVKTYDHTGRSLMDFAWDYAGNLYIAADHATNGERIAVYAMPHAADRVVSTPAASKYAFTVNCQTGATYQVTTICNPSEAGTITCSVAGNTRAAGVLTLESCTELTVTATPEDGYKFLNWTDGNGNILSTETEYSLYVTENITLQANFEYATYTGIVWKNLFLYGEDIAVSSENKNTRLWRLLQVQYNEDYPDQLSKDVNGYHQVYYFFDSAFRNGHSNSRETIRTNLKTFVDSEYGDFYWLGKYIENLVNVGDISNNSGVWGWYLQAFINRINGFLNADCNATLSSLSADGKTYPGKDFSVYGQPKHWRPYWAESVCNLPMTMKYSDYMPILSTWTRPDCPSGSIAGVTPSSWYKWNEPHETLNPSVCDVPYEKYFILAWRNGGPTEPEIVHNVYESNMELHASYVLKNIDEEDRVNPNANDASNDDVIQLMQNRRYVDLNEDLSVVPTHTLTVTRKLQADMFNTICLPFGVDLTTLQDDQNYSHPLRDAEAYEFAGTTASTYDESGAPVTILNFNKVTQLQAGKPYLVKLKKGKGDVIGDMTFSSVSCNTTLTPSVGGGLIFQPTINPTEVPAGSLILVANDRLALTTSAGEMMGMRGYFMIDPSNPLLADDIAEQAKDGRVYLSFKKPTTTSLPMAPEAEQQTKPQVRKIMYDGKIYILRGDEVYTITGHRVK